LAIPDLWRLIGRAGDSTNSGHLHAPGRLCQVPNRDRLGVLLDAGTRSGRRGRIVGLCWQSGRAVAACRGEPPAARPAPPCTPNNRGGRRTWTGL